MTFRDKIQKATSLIKEYINENCCVAVSFGKDSMVLLDLVRKVKKIPILAVLSDTEFPETLELMNKVLREWKLDGDILYFENSGKPEECCRAIKVDTFAKGIKKYDLWFAGLRRSEGSTREGMDYIVKDRFGKIKVNPILDFDEKDIWRYLAINQIPVNPLYKEYRSLSCSQCSAKEMDEAEPERAGRWKGTSHEGKECGLHSYEKE